MREMECLMNVLTLLCVSCVREIAGEDKDQNQQCGISRISYMAANKPKIKLLGL